MVSWCHAVSWSGELEAGGDRGLQLQLISPTQKNQSCQSMACPHHTDHIKSPLTVGPLTVRSQSAHVRSGRP